MTELQPGTRFSHDVTVSADHSPRHLAPTVVLSTPTMIGMMERAATSLAQPALGERTSVGTHVNVSHESAAREGEIVTFEAELLAINGRRLEFTVLARVGDRVIGRGTHQRTIIDRDRFAGS